MHLDCEQNGDDLQMANLEGKLKDVNVGDIILIKGTDGNAVGYVESLDQIRVCLAPRDISYRAKYRTHDDMFSPTSTNYLLRKFEEYAVLKKKE